MKKTLFIISVLVALPLFSTRAIAQNEDASFEIVSSDSGVVTLDAAEYIGFGYNLLKSNDFTCSGSGEFFVNILDLKVYPTPAFGIEIGVNYKTMDFNSKDNFFYLDGDKKIQVGKTADQYGGMEKFRSRFRSNTFSAPVMLNFVAGTTRVGLGVEGNMNLTGRVKNKYFENDQKIKDIKKGAQFERYNYNFLATLSFDGTGVYFRYYPKNSRILPEGSVNVGFMAVGFIFDM
jgi:hypothetical protein